MRVSLRILILLALCLHSLVQADPPPPMPPSSEPLPNGLFCFRIMDMERVDLADGTPLNDFAVQFESLNWSDSDVSGLQMALNTATTEVLGTVPNIAGLGIDRDGRGGPLGGRDIDASGFGFDTGAGTFDEVAVHSGRGRGDVSGALNDWNPVFLGVAPPGIGTAVRWDMSGPPGSTPVPARNLMELTALGGLLPVDRVPGIGTDATGDSAVDGGPGPYDPMTGIGSGNGAGPPVEGTGNSLDGFTLTVQDWDIGEVFSVNWYLDDMGTFIGSPGVGNPFGFGIMSMVRIVPEGILPGAVAFGVGADAGRNAAGFIQQDFYGDVSMIPPDSTRMGTSPAEFGAEFGAALTLPFLNPSDNQQNLPVNAEPVQPTFCDINGDFQCDIVDIDELITAIASGSTDSIFDVNLDGAVDLGDRDAWLADAGALNLPSQESYLLADFDLNGNVDGHDFIIWNEFKFTETALWSAGDVQADGVVDGQDFIIWNENKFQGSDLASVPEPTASALVWCLLSLAAMSRSRLNQTASV